MEPMFRLEQISKRYGGKLQTVIEDLDLPNPVIRSHYGKGFVKQETIPDRGQTLRSSKRVSSSS